MRIYGPFVGPIEAIARAKPLKILALPSGARQHKKISDLAGGLGKSNPVDLQYVSRSLPKPSERPPDKRNAAPAGNRNGAQKSRKRAAFDHQKYDGAEAASTAETPRQRKKPTLQRTIARKYADERAAQRADHLEIARRYAWDDRRLRKHRRSDVRTVVRQRNLEKLFDYRYGPTLPDDDAGRDDLFIAGHNIAQLRGDAAEHIRAWASLWAPWIADDELSALIEKIAQAPLRWRADTLAWRLGLTDEVRTLLGITTIGAIDCSKAERAARRRMRNNQDKTARRREAGAISRAEYESSSVARAEPWEALGISRRTWYRRGKPLSPEKPLSMKGMAQSGAGGTSPGAPDVSYTVGPQLCHDGDDRPGARSKRASPATGITGAHREKQPSEPDRDTVQSSNMQTCTADEPAMHPSQDDQRAPHRLTARACSSLAIKCAS
jgi:hypothetical protein